MYQRWIITTNAISSSSKRTLNTINFSEERGLDRRQILYLGECEWIRNHLNVIIEGATGTGKTYLSCALGHAACRHGYSVRYFRMSAFKREIGAHRLDGTIDRYFTALRKVNLIIFDDWLLEGLDLAATQALLPPPQGEARSPNFFAPTTPPQP